MEDCPQQQRLQRLQRPVIGSQAAELAAGMAAYRSDCMGLRLVAAGGMTAAGC